MTDTAPKNHEDGDGGLSPASIRHARVVLVDGDADTRDRITELLRNGGFEVKPAAIGQAESTAWQGSPSILAISPRENRPDQAPVRALRRSEERFSAFTNATFDVVYRMNADWTEMLQLRGGEFIADTPDPSRSWLERYIAPTDRSRVMQAINHAIETEDVFELEHRVIRTDGSLGWTHSRAVPVLSDDGEILEWIGAASDITERKQAKEALRESQERMAFVRRSTGVGYWYCDLPFDVLHWDEQVKAHFHLPPEAVVTIETFYERLHPDDRERTRQAIALSIEQHEPYDIDYRTVHPDTGAIKWIRAIGRTDYASDDTPVRFDGVTFDVTTAKRSLEQAAASADRLTLIADAMPALISYVDADERYQFNNRAYEDWFGQREHNLTGRHIRDVLGNDAYQVIARHIRDALSGNRVGFEAEIPYKAAGTRIVHCDYVPDERPDGSVAGFYALVTDITQRRQHEKARARLAAIVQSSRDAIISKTLDGVIETWNDGAEQMFGYTAEEAIGRSVKMLIPEDRLDEEARIIGAIRRGERIKHYETLRRRKDGSLVDVSLTVSPVLDAAGRVIGASKIARDITERKQFEQALRRSELRFKIMANAAPAMLWVTAPDGSATFLSRGWLEYTGQTEQGAKGFGWLKAVHPDDREHSERIFVDANEERDPFSLDYRLRRADGEYRWCIDAAKPCFDEAENFLGYVGSVIDVHERKQAETALRKSEQRFRGLFESMDEGYCVAEVIFDDEDHAVDYRLIEMNPAFDKHTGMRGLLGKSMRESVPDLEEFWFETYGRVAKTGEPIRFVHQAKPLGDRWFDVYAFRLEDDRSNKVAILFNDISERIAAEQSLLEAHERVVRARDYAEATLRTSPVPLLVLEDDLRVKTANEAFYEIFRVQPEETEGRFIYELGNRQWDISRLRELLEDILPYQRSFKGFEVEHDFEIIGKRSMLLSGSRMDNEADEPDRIVLVIEDITEHKRHEQQMKTVMAELNHRVKNTLAVVNAIASQTVRRSPNLKSFSRSFGERLQSIANAHSLLTSTEWEGCSLEEIVRSEVDSRLSTPSQARIVGPPVMLSPKQCLAIHLIVHELSTNAMKYGALKHEHGTIDISWCTEHRDDERWLRLEWHEACEHEIAEPSEMGYGSRLIEQSVEYELHGELEKEFSSEGLRCVFSFPLEERTT